jgi:hypothetical protein
VGLGHRLLGAVEAVEDQLAEEPEAHLPGDARGGARPCRPG